MSSNFKNYLNSYVFETVLPGSGETISFKPVTTGQLKKLLLYETSEDTLSIETALDEMIEECVIKPEDFDISDQYIQDRFFLLVEIRKATRGSMYNFQTICTSCSSQTQQVLNLSNLTVAKLNKGFIIKAEEPVITPAIRPSKQKKGKLKLAEETQEEITPVEISVPDVIEWNIVKINDHISVKLDLVTRSMQQEAFDIFMEKHKNGTIRELERTLDITTMLYALSINSVITPDGEDTDLSLEEKVFLLDNIRQEEQEKISKWFDDHDFGLDFSFDVRCSHCGFTEKKAVPVENFFY